MLSTNRSNLLEVLKQFRTGATPLHCISNNGFGERLRAARFANEEEWDPQLNADDHHEDVLLQCLITCNICVWLQVHVVKEHVLTPESFRDFQ